MCTHVRHEIAQRSCLDSEFHQFDEVRLQTTVLLKQTADIYQISSLVQKM